MITKIGYPCIHTKLDSPTRTCRKKTLHKKGYDWVASLAWENLRRLKKVLQWNLEHNIKLFRISSDLIPWKSEYEWEDLPNYLELFTLFNQIESLIKLTGSRVSFHPGPYNVLASPTPEVVENTIKDLEMHGDIMDKLNLEQSTQFPINIHVGGAYGDKTKTLQRFKQNLNKLSPSVRKRLTIENDHKPSMYNVDDLLSLGVPIMYDFHHSWCSWKLQGLSLTQEEINQKWEEEAKKAFTTWPKGITPIFHWSESKNPKSKTLSAHATHCNQKLPQWSFPFDLMIESKGKQESLYTLKETNPEVGPLVNLK